MLKVYILARTTPSSSQSFSSTDVAVAMKTLGAKGPFFVRANDAKIVRSRDAQCNTVESPQRLTYCYHKTTLGSLCWPVYDFFKLIASYPWLFG